MANKYGSNVRTYVARNLIWNGQASVVVPHAMNAPNDIALNQTYDFVAQPVKANWGYVNGASRDNVEWLIGSNFIIKRLGIFSNFADGLVFSNNDTRLNLRLEMCVASTEEHVGTALFTQGNNYISGTGLDHIFESGQCFISDHITPYKGNIYSVYDVSPTALRLSDYSYDTISNGSVFKVLRGSISNVYNVLIPALNTMYDQEYFFPALSEIDSTYQIPMIVAVLEINPKTNFSFYTKTIDTAFNTLPVTFDAVMEIEITSQG